MGEMAHEDFHHRIEVLEPERRRAMSSLPMLHDPLDAHPQVGRSPRAVLEARLTSGF